MQHVPIKKMIPFLSWYFLSLYNEPSGTWGTYAYQQGDRAI